MIISIVLMIIIIILTIIIIILMIIIIIMRFRRLKYVLFVATFRTVRKIGLGSRSGWNIVRRTDVELYYGRKCIFSRFPRNSGCPGAKTMSGRSITLTTNVNMWPAGIRALFLFELSFAFKESNPFCVWSAPPQRPPEGEFVSLPADAFTVAQLMLLLHRVVTTTKILFSAKTGSLTRTFPRTTPWLISYRVAYRSQRKMISKRIGNPRTHYVLRLITCLMFGSICRTNWIRFQRREQKKRCEQQLLEWRWTRG